MFVKMDPHPFLLSNFPRIPEKKLASSSQSVGASKTALADASREPEMCSQRFRRSPVLQNSAFHETELLYPALLNVRNMLRSCHIEGRLDVNAGDMHRGSFLAALPAVSLPLPVPLQLLPPNLDMLATNPVSHHVQLLPSFWFFFPFPDEK